MRSAEIFTIIILSGILMIGMKQENDETKGADRQAIADVLADYQRTWNRHDMEAWGRLFTNDVDYVNRGGGIWHGNKTNVAEHRRIHEMLEQQDQQMDWSARIERVTFLNSEIALVHATWQWPGLKRPASETKNDFRGILSMIMVKRNGKWLIRALHNTVAQQAEPSGGS